MARHRKLWRVFYFVSVNSWSASCYCRKLQIFTSSINSL